MNSKYMEVVNSCTNSWGYIRVLLGEKILHYLINTPTDVHHIIFQLAYMISKKTFIGRGRKLHLSGHLVKSNFDRQQHKHSSQQAFY